MRARDLERARRQFGQCEPWEYAHLLRRCRAYFKAHGGASSRRHAQRVRELELYAFTGEQIIAEDMARDYEGGR